MMEKGRFLVVAGRFAAWVVASAVGGAAAGVLGGCAFVAVDEAAGHGPGFLAVPGGALVGALVGMVFGAAQWPVLWRRVSRSGFWVLASAAGGLVGGVLMGMGVALTVGGREVLVVAAIMGGAAIGAAQWLVLWDRVRFSGWWVAASVVGWVVSWPVGLAVFLVLGWPMGVFWAGAVGGLIGGAVFGIVTGPVIAWLLEHPARKGPVIRP